MFFLQDEKKINHLLFYSPWTQGNLLIASQVCRWSHKRLPPAFYLYLSFICDVITMAVREQLGMWAGGRIYLCFSQAQDLDFVPDSLEQNWICGNFPTIVKVITNHYKFPQIQFCSSESGTESRSCAWEKYKYILPPAHILSCSLTAMVITSHMNGKQRGESQVPGNRVIKQLISSAPMSTHLKGGGDLEPLSCSVAVKRATSHLSQFCSFWL